MGISIRHANIMNDAYARRSLTSNVCERGLSKEKVENISGAVASGVRLSPPVTEDQKVRNLVEEITLAGRRNRLRR